MQLKVCLKTIFMLGTGMPKIPISKTQVIASPIEKVFEVLRDVHSCPSWSPWLIVDPDCKLDIQNDYYSWEGCSKALHDYLSKHKRPERIVKLYKSGCYLIKQ